VGIRAKKKKDERTTIKGRASGMANQSQQRSQMGKHCFKTMKYKLVLLLMLLLVGFQPGSQAELQAAGTSNTQ